MNASASAENTFDWLLTELLIVIAIIAVAAAVFLPNSEVAVFKAKFTEVLLALSSKRTDVMEHYAQAGAWSGVKLAQKPESPASPGMKPTAPPRVNVSVIDSSVVAEATLRGRTFTAGMRPAVADLSENWSVVWLCGARQAPAGWQAAPGVVVIDLPTTHIPSVCRPAFRQ